MSTYAHPLHYSVVLEWEPVGGHYLATVPELPGCRTHGDTIEEALKNGLEVIESWIDSAQAWGDPIPPPRFFELDSIGPPLDQAFLSDRTNADDSDPHEEDDVERPPRPFTTSTQGAHRTG